MQENVIRETPPIVVLFNNLDSTIHPDRNRQNETRYSGKSWGLSHYEPAIPKIVM